MSRRAFCRIVEYFEEDWRANFTINAEGWNTTQTRYSDLAGTSLIGSTETDYDDAGRITHIVAMDDSSVMFTEFEYVYTNGNLASRTETQDGTTDTKTYGYDNANQLTDDDGVSHTYDSTGNREDAGYSTGPDNRIATDGTWNYTHDANGNVTTKATVGATSESWTYDYDDANHLITVKHFDANNTLVMQGDYAYDAFGLRIEKIIDADGAGGGAAVTSRYAYDGWNPAKSSGLVGRENFDVRSKLDDTSSLATQYLYSDKIDNQLARIDLDSTADVRWAIADYQGSIRTILDGTGAVIGDLAYDAFGNKTLETAPTMSGEYGYTGREWDKETELQYNRARWYDPKTGRWLTQDPLGFDAGDTNLYRYVRNMPTMSVDPSGFAPIVSSFDIIKGLPSTATVIAWNEYSRGKDEMTRAPELNYETARIKVTLSYQQTQISETVMTIRPYISYRLRRPMQTTNIYRGYSFFSMSGNTAPPQSSVPIPIKDMASTERFKQDIHEYWQEANVVIPLGVFEFSIGKGELIAGAFGVTHGDKSIVIAHGRQRINWSLQYDGSKFRGDVVLEEYDRAFYSLLPNTELARLIGSSNSQKVVEYPFRPKARPNHSKIEEN